MNKIDALRRVAELKRVIRDAIIELEQLRSQTFGGARRSGSGRMVRITFKDGTHKIFLSIASAARVLKKKLGVLSDRRTTRYELYALAAKLGAKTEIELTDRDLEEEGL